MLHVNASKWLKFGAMAFMCAALITSCDPDPEPDPKPAPGEDGDDIENPSGGSADGQYVITRISYDDDYEEYETRMIYDAKGRVIAEVGEEFWSSYSYSKNVVEYKSYEGVYPDDSDEQVCDYYPLRNGLIDADGFCFDSSKQYIGNDDGLNVMWKSGKITGYTFKYSRYESGYQSQIGSATVNYGNPQDVNAGCIKCLNSLALSLMLENNYSWLVSGLMGKVPTQLISGATYEDFDIEDEDDCYFVKSLRFSNLDQNDCPRSMVISYIGGESETYKLTWTRI